MQWFAFISSVPVTALPIAVDISSFDAIEHAVADEVVDPVDCSAAVPAEESLLAVSLFVHAIAAIAIDTAIHVFPFIELSSSPFTPAQKSG
jgi:hypothetical protein